MRNSFKEILNAEVEYEANQETEGKENLKALDELKSKGEQKTLQSWFDQNEERKRKVHQVEDEMLRKEAEEKIKAKKVSSLDLKVIKNLLII